MSTKGRIEGSHLYSSSFALLPRLLSLLVLLLRLLLLQQSLDLALVRSSPSFRTVQDKVLSSSSSVFQPPLNGVFLAFCPVYGRSSSMPLVEIRSGLETRQILPRDKN